MKTGSVCSQYQLGIRAAQVSKKTGILDPAQALTTARDEYCAVVLLEVELYERRCLIRPPPCFLRARDVNSATYVWFGVYR